MSKLAEIAAQRRLDVVAAKAQTPLAALTSRAAALISELGPPLSLACALQQPPPTQRLNGQAKLHVAAEFKRASPSKGDMAPDTASVTEQVGKPSL